MGRTTKEQREILLSIRRNNLTKVEEKIVLNQDVRDRILDDIERLKKGKPMRIPPVPVN